jgi:hypothetical protein
MNLIYVFSGLRCVSWIYLKIYFILFCWSLWDVHEEHQEQMSEDDEAKGKKLGVDDLSLET